MKAKSYDCLTCSFILEIDLNMIHKHHHRSEVTFYWSKAHSEQSLKAHVYTHMNINPEWIYWLAKISWHSDINFTVFVLQIVIILPWKKRWHYSLRCLCCSISHVSVVLWQTKGVMENKMQMGQRGEISLKQKNRTLARPWFCINLYWNVNEYKKKSLLMTTLGISYDIWT